MDMPSACYRRLGDLAVTSSACRKEGNRGRQIFWYRVPGRLLWARGNGRQGNIVRSWAGSQGIDMP